MSHPPELSVYVIVIEFGSIFPNYARLTRPIPALSYADYPFPPGGRDKRWIESSSMESEEDGLQWVGGLMSVFTNISAVG